MPALPRDVRYAEAVGAFVRAGWTERTGKGSHRVVKMVNGTVLSIPSGTLKVGTLGALIKLAEMTTDEFVAVIGHELGHFRGDDTKFSERFYPIYRGTAASIVSLHVAGGRGWGQVSLLPAIAVFGFFLEAFSSAERRLSRERELAADQAGASVAGAPVIRPRPRAPNEGHP